MIEFALERFGALNIMINNAGAGAQKHFIETPLQTLRAMLDVNVTRHFPVCAGRCASNDERGRRCVVNFSRIPACWEAADELAYAASKGGIIAMTRVMAVSLAAHKIRVNATAPGP